MEYEEKEGGFDGTSILVKAIIIFSIIFVVLLILILVIAFIGECSEDSDCSEKEACKDRECVSLTTDSNCGSLGNKCGSNEYCDNQTLSCVKKESDKVGELKKCTNDSDCKDGICQDGTCYEISGCFEDRHCPEGQVCNGSKCVVPECTSDSDCSGGEKCVDNNCFDENANCSVTGCEGDSCCIKGECIPEEEYLDYNCSTLGYDCGSYELCNKYLYCGGCSGDRECVNGICISNSSLILQIMFEKDSYEINNTTDNTTEYILIKWDDEIENKEDVFEGLVFYQYSNNEGNSGTLSSIENIEEGTQSSNINKQLNTSDEGDYIFMLEVYNCTEVNNELNVSDCGEESSSLRNDLEEISPIESTREEIEVY